ncbi:MAG: GHKL domain-containing protein [candidate division Zixibacteria bacterium]|nr:GHKL domain-containing protein [candidate division Zixibacteria bacterium]
MTQQWEEDVRSLNDSQRGIAYGDKSVLALDALATLTGQFADNPTLGGLAEALAYTIAGQFSVANAFVAVKSPDERLGPAVVFGTGKYHGRPELAQVDRCVAAEAVLRHQKSPIPVETLRDHPLTNQPAADWLAADVRFIAPFFSGERLIGVMGLGNKVGGRPFSDRDFDLAAAFINTITPLVANAFIFAEISYLNARYSDILNNVTQAILIIDENGIIRTINTVGRDLLKRISPAAVGDLSPVGVSIERIFVDETFPGWIRRFSRAGLKESDSRTENLVAFIDGSERIFSATIGAVSGATAGRSDTIVTLYDVTAQKDVEQRLFDLERFAEKGMMASSIAHELNNFLGLILGGVELLQMYLEKGITSTLADTLEKLKANVDTMTRFTAGLMDYSRLDTEKRKGNLNAVLNDVMSFIAVQRRFTRIKVETDLDPDLPGMDMDSDQLSQLLINLLNNAADAIAEAKHPDGRIVIATHHDDDRVILSISDNGVGITPEVKEKLFKEHLTTKKTGHGYGLVTCSKIVANHQGTVDIDSVFGEGATFRFQFPYAAAPVSGRD